MVFRAWPKGDVGSFYLSMTWLLMRKVQVNLSQFSRGSIKATRNRSLTHDYNKLLQSV